jgi:hypothetical protein
LNVQWQQSGGFKLPTSALMGKQQQTKYGHLTLQNHLKPSLQVLGIDGNEVISGWFTTGQQVVVAGVHVVHEGQKVRPMATKPLERT